MKSQNYSFKHNCLALFFLALFNQIISAQGSSLENKSTGYPYWKAYAKTLIAEIKNPLWIAKDSISTGWDWSLPKGIKPSKQSNLCIARNFSLTPYSIENLPNINFAANPVISHWVKWRELEATEGNIDFTPLIRNIKLAKEKGYGSIVRLHFSATDFAPDWIKKYDIPIRKENKKNPIKINYEVCHPEFHKRYVAFIAALGKSRIPQMEEVKGLFLGYASPSNGDEGIGPYHGDAIANDTIQHVRERIDAWAEVTSGVEHKVFMGGVSNYGLEKGFGIRRGFVEMYLYHIPDDEIGQKLDDQGYLYVEESNPIIRKNSFHGEENEEYEEKWATQERDFRFGKTTDSYVYRYFTANLRLLQMRCNYVLNNEFSLLPEMFTWVSLSLGRTTDDSPDAWCFLRESYIRKKGGTPVKNFERWVYQRDAPNYETTPVIKINQPIEMWMVQPEKYYDYIARKGKKIGFDVEDKFHHKTKNFAVKISYVDVGSGDWSLVFQGKKGVEKRKVLNKNSGNIKTITFFIETNFENKTIPFDLEIHGENDFEPTISFLRIIKV